MDSKEDDRVNVEHVEEDSEGTGDADGYRVDDQHVVACIHSDDIIDLTGEESGDDDDEWEEDDGVDSRYINMKRPAEIAGMDIQNPLPRVRQHPYDGQGDLPYWVYRQGHFKEGDHVYKGGRVRFIDNRFNTPRWCFLEKGCVVCGAHNAAHCTGTVSSGTAVAVVEEDDEDLSADRSGATPRL
jgi:hypothetical protein